MAHDAAHQVTHINSAPACRASKDISLTVTAHVSASDCSSTQGALLQSRRHGEKANSIVSTQYQIPTSGPFSGVLPWPQAGSLGCGCSTRRSSSVTTDKKTNRGLCGRRQAASLPSLLWQNWLKIAELEGCGADHPLVCTLRGQRALWFSELSLCFRGYLYTWLSSNSGVPGSPGSPQGARDQLQPPAQQPALHSLVFLVRGSLTYQYLITATRTQRKSGWEAQGFQRFVGEAAHVSVDLQAQKPDSQGSLEAGGESRPCASLGLVKDVTISPEGLAQYSLLQHWCFGVWLVGFWFLFLRLTRTLEIVLAKGQVE